MTSLSKAQALTAAEWEVIGNLVDAQLEGDASPLEEKLMGVVAEHLGCSVNEVLARTCQHHGQDWHADQLRAA